MVIPGRWRSACASNPLTWKFSLFFPLFFLFSPLLLPRHASSAFLLRVIEHQLPGLFFFFFLFHSLNSKNSFPLSSILYQSHSPPPLIEKIGKHILIINTNIDREFWSKISIQDKVKILSRCKKNMENIWQSYLAHLGIIVSGESWRMRTHSRNE